MFPLTETNGIFISKYHFKICLTGKQTRVTIFLVQATIIPLLRSHLIVLLLILFLLQPKANNRLRNLFHKVILWKSAPNIQEKRTSYALMMKKRYVLIVLFLKITRDIHLFLWPKQSKKSWNIFKINKDTRNIVRKNTLSRSETQNNSQSENSLKENKSSSKK